MAHLGGSYDFLGKSMDDEIQASTYLDEYDRLPLKQRLKTLLASKGLAGVTDVNLGILENGSKSTSMPHTNFVVKNEDEHRDSQDVVSFDSSCFVAEESTSELSQEQGHTEMSIDTVADDPCLQSASSRQYMGTPGSFDFEGNQVNSCFFSNQKPSGEVNAHTIGADRVIANVGSSLEQPVLPNIPAVKVENCDSNPVSSLGDGVIGSAGSDIQAVKRSNEIPSDFVDEFDCISLRERQRMLLSRKSLGMMMPTLQGNSERLSNQVMEGHAGGKSGVSHFVNGGSPMAGNPPSNIPDGTAPDLYRTSRSASSNGTVSGSSCITHQCSPLVGFGRGTDPTKSRSCIGVEESFQISSSEKISTKFNPCDVQGFVLALPCSTIGSALLTSAKVKAEPSDCNDLCCSDNIETTKSRSCMGFHESDQKCSSENINNVINLCDTQDDLPNVPYTTISSALSTSLRVKDELLDNNYSNSLDKNAVGCSFTDFLSLKSELQTHDGCLEDLVDHMPLQDRIKLLMAGDAYNMNASNNFEDFMKTGPSFLESRPIASEPFKPISSKRPRKRKKTATDSVETALEEDAPGLLQALVDKGVSMDEIKLYGDMENDDTLDSSFNEESFSQLEAVISKIFSQRQSLLKFAPIRCTKGAKASYCLACLVSLVDQTQYLRFRKWPVEWGWCRDLQSFIFVFERHNRIVLERPEYGFATYFFELADLLPIDWQIKRLVTAMKLTNFSRITLIENKALLVGEDLSEGEAKVLMEYGWTPNSGLATMLNYRDRVVHDRKNEDEGVEWRSKIGKLLMDGYNGGTLVSKIIPKKVTEYNSVQSPQIKLEL